MTPTLPALYGILLQAAKDMAYRPGRVLNAFAVVDGVPDLGKASYGYTHDDYRAGRFWSRKWAEGGADPSTIVGQYPVVMPELLSSRPLGGGLVEHTVDVTYIDHLEGLDPAGCYGPRPGAAVYAGLLELSLAHLGEVKRYQAYDTDYGPVWSVPERMASEVRDYQADALDVELRDHLTGPDDLKPWGDYPSLRGLFLTLTLTECIDAGGVAFRYDRTDADHLGVVTCAGQCS